ncbi:MAG TPA: GAF domain-containing protein, partial [Solirubrobacterales bacterium]|nr:GAF domain-containing protein [Solirubrobacterales bacterium]
MTSADREPTTLSDLVASLAAIGHSMQDGLDPRRFLGEFSGQIQRLVPHDRLVIDYLDDGGRTFTVFAEHAVGPAPMLHEQHYTTTFDPGGRYVVAEWGIAPVFAGKPMRVDDFTTDPRFARPNAHERRVAEAGLRSALLVPLRAGGRVGGALVFTSTAVRAYTEAHLAAAGQIADLIGPLIESTVLLERERRRRRRLQAVQALTRVLGSSLNVREIFDRLADEVRPVLDFDIMGVALLSSSGREVEILAEVDNAPVLETPPRIRLDDFTFGQQVETGEPILLEDALRELDPERPGDRLITEGGGRSVLCVPLWFAERVGGGLYLGKRQPHWFDRTDIEVAGGIAAQLVLALQHQRLADEARRLALAEGRARRLERRVESLETAL